MKNLKFRAWIKHLEIMVKVERINFDVKTIECYLADEEEGDLSEFGFDEIELMHHTDLEDRNGIGIYSGDIIRSYHQSGEVFFRLGSFMIKENVREFLTLYDICDRGDLYKVQIIGNKFQNPELLEA